MFDRFFSLKFDGRPQVAPTGRVLKYNAILTVNYYKTSTIRRREQAPALPIIINAKHCKSSTAGCISSISSTLCVAFFSPSVKRRAFDSSLVRGSPCLQMRLGQPQGLYLRYAITFNSVLTAFYIFLHGLFLLDNKYCILYNLYNYYNGEKLEIF